MSGFRREVDEICAVVGCYAAYDGNLLPIGCPETSAINYHRTLRNIPEERIFFWINITNSLISPRQIIFVFNRTSQQIATAFLNSIYCTGSQMRVVWCGDEICKFLVTFKLHILKISFSWLRCWCDNDDDVDDNNNNNNTVSSTFSYSWWLRTDII